jgi:hypothetical protein
MATGSISAALIFQFMRGKRTISGTIADMTSAIWTTLQPLFMPPTNESKWKCIAERSLEIAKLHRFNRWETCPHKMLS